MTAPEGLADTYPAPGHVIITRPDTTARHNEAHACHPGIHPQLHHPTATGPRRAQLAPADQSPGQIAWLLRLYHRRAARRRADAAVPAPLRRLGPLLRLRDLLTRPATATKTAPNLDPTNLRCHPQASDYGRTRRAVSVACVMPAKVHGAVKLCGPLAKIDNTEIRLYRAAPCNSIYRADQGFLINQHVYALIVSSGCPVSCARNVPGCRQR